MISGDSDEDDVFVPNSKQFQHSKQAPHPILDHHRQLHLSPPSSDNVPQSQYRNSYTNPPSSCPSPVSLEQHHPMMRRLEMESRYIGGSVASTSSTSSSASPKSCIIPPHPQLTPPLPHPMGPQHSVSSPHYLPPTPPSPYLPASPFYHQYQQMLAAHRYQMLSQYAVAAAAANLPSHPPPFYPSNGPHFGFSHTPLSSSLNLSTNLAAPGLPRLPTSSSASSHLSPPLYKFENRSPSPAKLLKADSTTAIVSPSRKETKIQNPLSHR